jgi:hypothetical protein
VSVSRDILLKLEAQRAYFASDERIKERVALWADATPLERLLELGDDSALERLAPDQLDRLLTLRNALPDDTVAILEALRRSNR